MKWPWSKPKSSNNVYTVLNDELHRMHNFMRNRCKPNSEATNTAFNRIVLLQDALIQASQNQPNDAEVLKDLQETVADMVLD